MNSGVEYDEPPLTDAQLQRLRLLADEWMEPSSLSLEFELGLILDQLLDEHEEFRRSRIE